MMPTFKRHVSLCTSALHGTHPHWPMYAILELQALKHVDIDEQLQRFLLRPQREIHVELVITMDSGEIESFNAYRVQHNNFRGPYKGGYRLAPDVDMQEMRRSALRSSCSMQRLGKRYHLSHTNTGCLQFARTCTAHLVPAHSCIC